MIKILGFEWKRCIRGKGLRAAFWFSVFLAVGHFLTFCVWYQKYQLGGVLDTQAQELLRQSPDGSRVYPACLYEGFIGGEGFTFWNELYFFLLPLLAVFPFGSSLFQDEKTGYLKNIFICVRKRDFLFAKGIIAFLSGAVCAAAPFVMSFLLNALYLPAVIPNPVAKRSNVIDRMSMSDWYYSKPWLYFGAYLLLIMLCGGVLSVMALVVSFVAKNSLVVLVAPFLAYYTLDYLCIQINKAQYSLCRLINQFSGTPKLYVSVRNIFFGLIAMAVAVMVFYLAAGCRREKIY